MADITVNNEIMIFEKSEDKNITKYRQQCQSIKMRLKKYRKKREKTSKKIQKEKKNNKHKHKIKKINQKKN